MRIRYQCNECKFSSQVITKNQIDNLLWITYYSYSNNISINEPMADVKYRIYNS